MSARVAVLSESTALGGGERVVAHLLEYYQRVGLQVHLIVPEKVRNGWLDGFAQDRGVPCHYVPLTTGSVLGAIGSIHRILRAHRIRHLHAHMFGMICVGAVAARMANAEMVATLHNGNEDWSLGKRRIPLAIALRLASRRTVVSEEMLRSSASATWLRREQFSVVYNGAQVEVDSPRSLRKELSIGENEKIVLCLGSRTINKNHVAAVRAAALLDFPVHVVIAGRDADGSAELDRAIEETDVMVHCLGHRADTTNLLRDSDVMVLPSRREGLPMVIVEAMLAGTPIIASAVGGIPEVLVHQQSGLLFSPDDTKGLSEQMREVLQNPERARQFAASARQFAGANLTVEAMGKAYLRLLGVNDHGGERNDA